METLRLPSAHFRVKSTEKGRLIFDTVRKKFVHLSPEEWVRQHVINWLHKFKKVPLSLINIEKQLIIAGTVKRYDIVVFKKDGSIDTIVECKAPSVKISQEVFDQIARYNLITKANYLMITNGLNHYYCHMDYDLEKYNFMEDLPDYIL